MHKEQIKQKWSTGRLAASLVNLYNTEDDTLLIAQMPGMLKEDAVFHLTSGECISHGGRFPIIPDCDCHTIREIVE